MDTSARLLLMSLARGQRARMFLKLPRRNYNARWIHSTSKALSLPSPIEYQESPREKQLSYRCELGTEPLVDWTLGRCLDKSALVAGNKTAYHFVAENNREVTFSQLQADVYSCCQGLLAADIKKGDSVLIMSPNSYNWAIMFSALAKLGILSASVHPAYTQQELTNAINKVKCKAIYIPESFQVLKFYENLCKWIPELSSSAPGQLNSAQFPFLKTVIADSNRNLPGTINMREIMEGGVASVEDAEAKVGCDDPLTVIFTSGTTGSAKAAVINHHGFINNAVIVTNMVRRTRGNAQAIVCNPLPLFHVFGLMTAVGQTLIGQQQVVFPSMGYDQVAMLKSIQDYGCTELSGSPTMYVDLIHHPRRQEFDLSSLKFCMMGGNICTPEVREFVKTNLNVDVLVGYGATETSTVASVVRSDDPEDKKMTTVGRPIEHVEMKVADPETGRELPVGEAGEVWIRSFNIFNGYLGEEEKTKEVMTSSRWYRTGDVGTMDSDGYFTICSRLKDLVIRGGENIHPIDVESLLDNHPAVSEAHVIGVPDKRMGEELCAWIVLNDGAQVTAQQLQDFLRDKLAYFKIPRYFIFDDDVPKTAIGKAQKNKMRITATKKLGL